MIFEKIGDELYGIDSTEKLHFHYRPNSTSSMLFADSSLSAPRPSHHTGEHTHTQYTSSLKYICTNMTSFSNLQCVLEKI